MNQPTKTLPPLSPIQQKPTQVRYGVLGFACSLSMITYLDRVCFGTVAPNIQHEFGLTDTQKGMLFSAFALAYAAFEVPSGWLGDVFGPRRTLIRIVLWWSAFTALTGMIFPSEHWPWFAFAAMLSVRFLFGIGEAGAYPNIARAFHNWFPFHERGFAQGMVWMAGRLAGGITPLVVLALLVKTREGDTETVAWRHTFWIFGSLGVLWCIAFWWWFCDRPEQKLGVNQAERDLIQGDEGPPEPALARVPWLKLLSNANLWVLCLMYFCAAYGWYFNITWLPGYLKDQYDVSTETWGFWTYSLMAGLPLLMGSGACLVGGILTDRFIRRTGNRKWGRRLFGVIGHSICAACFFVSIYAHNPWVFVLAIGFAAFWNDLTMGSAWASCLDIGKQYSGIVAGCMNTIGNLGGAAAGFTTGWILDSYTAAAKIEVTEATAAASQIAGSFLAAPGTGTAPLTGLGSAAASLEELTLAKQHLIEAAAQGWQVNFVIFALVYVLATFLWLKFDSTKPVLPEEAEKTARPAASIPLPNGEVR
jgi:MFS family permease